MLVTGSRAAFDQVELHNDADLARNVRAKYALGPDEAASAERAATTLATQYADDVRWAADTVRERLRQTLQEQPLKPGA
jgi:hypothetical protein